MNIPVAGRSWLAMAALAAAAFMVVVPNGIGFPTGIFSTGSPDPAAFPNSGCTACHGTSGTFAPNTLGQIDFAVKDAEGEYIGTEYEVGVEYTLELVLVEANAPEATNHAGFNIHASAGTLAGVEGISRTSDDGKEATHVDPTRTSWEVKWTAPEADSIVIFNVFVNDVNGEKGADPADQVHRAIFALTNQAGDVPGAAVEHEEHFGITLQQYWIGLIGLGGMIVIMVGGYVYLKYGNPHNTDPKDR